MNRTYKLSCAAFFLIASLSILSLQWSFIYDDSYIAFRYAANIAAGEGFVFNPGERVEGFSNVSWLTLLALVSKVLPLSMLVTAKLLGFVFFLLQMPLIWLVFSKLSDDFKSTDGASKSGQDLYALMLPLVIFLLLAVPSNFLWAISGLENGLYGCLLLLYFYLAIERRWIFAAFVLGVANFTRPEAMFFAYVPLLIMAFERYGQAEFLESFRAKSSRTALLFREFFSLSFRYIRNFFPFFLMMGAGLALRWVYFNDIVPNTYRVKVNGEVGRNVYAGAHYIYGFLHQHVFFNVAFVIAVPFSLMIRSRRLEVSTLLSMLLLQFAFVLFVGGDWMGQFRFISSFLPLMIVVIAVGALNLFTLLERLRVGVIVPALTASLALFVVPTLHHYRHRLVYAEQLEQSAVQAGKWLTKVAQKSAVVAVGDCGAIPYFSGLRTIDIHGLMDRHIATGLHSFTTNPHDTTDVNYILNRRPDFIVIIANRDYWLNKSSQGGYPAYGQILHHPSFQKDYQFVRQFTFSPEYYYHVYAREDSPNIDPTLRTQINNL